MLDQLMQPAGRRFDPIRQMQLAQADVNRLIDGLRFRPAADFPPLNLWTSPDGAIVTVEVPGVVPEEIDITIRRDTVILRGKRPAEENGEEAFVLRQERMHGPFARTVLLPFRLDADKATATFDRGILTLTLPRPEDDKPHQIKVARS